jgi:hypothetical protein
MGGVVCLDGIQVDKIGVMPPARPKPVQAPRAKGERAPRAEESVRAAVATGHWRKAARLALKLRSLGADKVTIQRMWDAYTRPAFCRELKRDPEQLIAAGIEVLQRRFASRS